MSESAASTLLGQAPTADEQQILTLYEQTKRLLAAPDLSPCAARNLRVSLAALWQIVNDLGLAYEPLYEYGV